MSRRPPRHSQRRRRTSCNARRTIFAVALELSLEITYAPITGVTAASRASAVWVVATHGLLALWAVRASAESAPVRVQLEAAACPSPSELEDKLEPLLERDLEVSDHPASSDARVIDRGPTFGVEVAGIDRRFGDVARDCVERARQAAVFIALNLKPAPSEPADIEVAPRLQVGVHASGELAYSRAQQRFAPGAGGGLWLAYGALRFAFSAALLFANEISVRSAEVGASARLMRVPLVWSGSYQLRLERFSVGPLLGAALDVLHMRGQGVARAQTKLRANLGVIGGLDSVLRVSPTLSVVARIGITVFPRAYSLSIAPLGPGGQTPKLWFSANLGVGWQFGG